MEVRMRYSFSNDAWEVFAYERVNGRERIPYKIKFEIEKSEKSDFYMEPSLIIRRSLDQSDNPFLPLIEGLAEAGLLKSSSSLENELKATKLHLADLQKAHDALLRKFSST